MTTAIAAFCANCGETVVALGLCPACHWDPQVPLEMTESYLKRLHSPDATAPADGLLVYPGEGTSLLLAVLVLTGAFAAITIASFGIILLIIAVALAKMRLSESHAHASLLKIGDHHRPDLASAIKVGAFRLGMPAPAVFIMQDERPNAYSTGFWRRHWTVLHSRLVDMLSPTEILFVIGHEMGHIRRQHTSWLVLCSPRGLFGESIITTLLGLIFNHWSLRAEYTADRAGLVGCRDIDAAVAALIKMEYWDTPVDAERLLDSWRVARSGPDVKISEVFRDHPYTLNRIMALRKFESLLRARGLA